MSNSLVVVNFIIHKNKIPKYSPLIWRSMNPGAIRALLQSIFREDFCFSSKNTFSGSTIFPFLTHKSSLIIVWFRRIRQFTNCWSSKQLTIFEKCTRKLRIEYEQKQKVEPKDAFDLPK